MFEVGDVVRFVGCDWARDTEEYADMGLSVGDLGAVVPQCLQHATGYIPVRFFTTACPPAHTDRGYWVMREHEITKEQDNG